MNVKAITVVLWCLAFSYLGTGFTEASSTLWPGTAVPGLVDAGADSPVELGTAFQADVAGTVTGIRFYKAITNLGTHIGNLWTSTGTLLATGTFTSESASGWQLLNLTSPVAIAANSRYIVSYHVNSGHYSADLSYFATAGVDAPPLHATANGIGGGNGLFVYASNSSFPSQTWNSSNYWVDVVFQSGTQSGTTAPVVRSVTPPTGMTGVPVGTGVTLAFSAPLNASTVNTNTIFLRDASNSLVSATVSYDSAGQTASLVPTAPLKIATVYTATAKGGAGGIADTLGNTMSVDYTWSFTTIATYGAKGGGPGGPILVLSDSANAFSEYYAEILLAEGLNEVDLKAISSVSSTTLSGYDVVILGQVALTSAQVSMLGNWVNAGGKLIAMRPDKQLASLLGLTDTGSSLAEGYLLVNTGSGAGAGIVSQTVQFHGVADRYTLAGATSLATLYSDALTATTNPAVTLRTIGINGGQAAAFTFDLARSIVYTRQGNPAWSGQDRDGISPIRSDDLFYGGATFDQQPDWVDRNKIAIPQADEQQRFLANLIISMNAAKKLLPRFWYFPHGYQAAVVMSGDDHDHGGTVGRFNRYLALSATNGSTADWGTIRATSYIYPGAISDSQAAALNAAGFEISLHLNTNCDNYTRSSLEQMTAIQLAQFTTAYPSLPAPSTERVHCVVWSDYTSLPEVELENGMRLDTTYYYWPAAWVADTPGFFTGSAIPMRFAKTDGNAIDVYQATTQMTDESSQTYPKTIDKLLDFAVGPNAFYGVFVANMHTDNVSSPGSDWILSSAKSRGVPIISAQQLLKWCDARGNSSMGSMSWANGTLAFSVKSNANAAGLEAMAPIPKGYAVSRATLNGSAISFSLRGVKGFQYAVVPAASGSYQLTYVQDVTAPVINSILPAQGSSGVYRNTAVTIAFKEAMTPSSVNATTVSLRTPSNSIVPASVSYNCFNFTASIAPANLLAASTKYTLVVKGGAGGASDIAGNVVAADVSSSFTTGTATSPSYTVWASSAIPGVASANDSSSVEVGTKFTSAKAGSVTAIRFYKGSGNTGTHTGSLWSSTGTQLVSINFAGETASGWQTQTLSTPVRIAANTTYVVSYHAPAGHYSADSGYFFAAGVNNYPLRALADGEDGNNGLYRYGTATAFPNQTWNSANSWVDVVFLPDP